MVSGPTWSPMQSILSVLLSIQSLMSENPIFNDRMYENKFLVSPPILCHNYNDIITHETIRVAVIGMLQENSADAEGMPTVLKEKMVSHFKAHYYLYESLVRSRQTHDGRSIQDPFHDKRPKTYGYKKLLEDLVALKERLGVANDDYKDEISSEVSDLSDPSEDTDPIKFS